MCFRIILVAFHGTNYYPVRDNECMCAKNKDKPLVLDKDYRQVELPDEMEKKFLRTKTDNRSKFSKRNFQRRLSKEVKSISRAENASERNSSSEEMSKTSSRQSHGLLIATETCDAHQHRTYGGEWPPSLEATIETSNCGQDCVCGPGCQCLGCGKHPHNEATMLFVKNAYYNQPIVNQDDTPSPSPALVHDRPEYFNVRPAYPLQYSALSYQPQRSQHQHTEQPRSFSANAQRFEEIDSFEPYTMAALQHQYMMQSAPSQQSTNHHMTDQNTMRPPDHVPPTSISQAPAAILHAANPPLSSLTNGIDITLAQLTPRGTNPDEDFLVSCGLDCACGDDCQCIGCKAHPNIQPFKSVPMDAFNFDLLPAVDETRNFGSKKDVS